MMQDVKLKKCILELENGVLKFEATITVGDIDKEIKSEVSGVKKVNNIMKYEDDYTKGIILDYELDRKTRKKYFLLNRVRRRKFVVEATKGYEGTNVIDYAVVC